MIKKLFLLVFFTAFPAFAQEIVEQSEPYQPLTFRVIAVGQTPPERYKTVEFTAESIQKEAEYLEKYGTAGLKSIPEDEEGKGPPPALSSGTVMIEEDPDEYPPRPVYLVTNKKAKPVFLWLTPGSPGQRIGLDRSSGFSLSRDDEGKGSFFSRAVDEATTHLTVFIIPPPGEVKWDSFKTVEMDTSPEKVPAGSVTLINFSRSIIVGGIGSQKVIVAPGKSQLVPASSALDDRGMVSLELKNRGETGELAGLTRTARRLRDSDRLFLIAYDAIEPLIEGQPVLLMSYVDSSSPAKVRATLKK